MDLRLHLVQVCLLWMRETILWVNKGGSLFNIRGITFSPRPACPKIRTVHSRSHPVPPPTHPDTLFAQDHLITEVPCTPTLGTFQSVLLVLRSSCHLARPQGQSGGTSSLPESQAGTQQKQLKLSPKRPKLHRSKRRLLNTTRERKLLFMGAPPPLC